MTCETSANLKRAGARYTRAMAVAALAYVAIVAIAVYTLDRFSPPQWAVIGLALAPLAPALLMLRAYLAYFRAMDEMQRRIQTEALLITLTVVGLGAFTYGFLEEWAGFAHVPLIWVLPAIILVWTAAQVFVRLRYK